MIRKQVDVHLEALAGFINDDDKLVTYKWLSKELSIHVNLSKQILFEYWDNHREDKSSLTATFLLIGYVEDGGMRVEVVEEKDLTTTKKNFSEIISEHIYSLQKTLPDLELLAIADNGDSEQSAVRCTEAVIRSDHEMEVLRWGSILPKNNIQSSAPKVQKLNNNEEINKVEQTNKVTKESGPKTSETKASKTTEVKTQKSAFNNLFAKAIDKQNKEKNTPSASSNNTKSKSTVSKKDSKTSPPKNAWFEAAKKPKVQKEQPENGKEPVNEPKVQEEKPEISKKSPNPPFGAPFFKQKISSIIDSSDSDEPSSSPKNKWSGSNDKSREKPDGSKSVSDNKSDDEKRKKKSPERIVSTSKQRSKQKAASTSRGKKRQSSSKTESINKKRKRIVVAESSEESGDSEMEGIEEPDSPEVPEVTRTVKSCPSPPLIKCEGGRRKVRKLVDKTFTDDDGYFVTRKEYVYESCSDKDEEVTVETVKPATSEPAVKNIQKRKQATLLNFFKKS